MKAYNCILMSVSLFLTGCASMPNVSELRADIRSVEIFAHGAAPLNFSTGVIDTGSFWAAYGGGVASQMGGGLLWYDLERDGQKQMSAQAAKNAALVKTMYGDHRLAQDIRNALLPKLAAIWGQRYNPNTVRAIQPGSISIEPETKILKGLNSRADLLLMLEVKEISLTEMFSVGGAFAAGFTMGTNEKDLTTTATIWMRAFKRDPVSAQHKQVWTLACGVDYVSMQTAFPMDELKASKEKVNTLLDETTKLSIERCSSAIASMNK